MDTRIQQLLEKRGIKDINELTPEEKKDLDRWQSVLSEGQMSVEKIVEFCKNQIASIKLEMKKVDTTADKIQRLVCHFNVYDTLLNAIQGQKSERDQLERWLQDQLTSG